MEVKLASSHRGFKSRLLKLYLPLLIIGLSGLTLISYKGFTPVNALPPQSVTRVAYSGSFSSGNSSASPVVSSSPPTSSCAADNGFRPAGAFRPAAGQTGLIERTDSPYSHMVYGSTADQLANLSRECPLVIPGDNEPYVNAYTSYWIGWQFDYQTNQAGLCQVTNATVLLNIRLALPVWADSGRGSAALNKQWQSYAAAVSSHENGHVQLTKQFAGQLLQSINALPAMDCAQVKQTVNQLGSNYLAQLSLANQTYDQQTQHGATQGAIVP